MAIDVAMGLHLAGAVAYWWLSPKGFPVDNSRFWLNSVLPWAFALASLMGLIAIHRKNWGAAGCAVLGISAAWLAGAIAARINFPVSLGVVWLLPLLIALCGMACFAWLVRGSPRSVPTWIPTAIVFALLGVFVVRAEVPLPPSTKPIDANVGVKSSAESSASVASPTLIRINEDCQFDPEIGSLLAKFGGVRVQCSQLLEFDLISPDGFWSLLGRRPPGRQFANQSRSGDGFVVRYSDDSTLEAPKPSQQDAARIIAYSTLKKDTYSHLNTYSYFSISGHKRLHLIFSPCPNTEVEVLSADYPVGRPARVAYLDATERFRVVEATSGEKGPFHPLAEGMLAAGQPLTITICDEHRPVASITLDDWSQQLSTDLSPTAGWGLPMNAIEFQRVGESLTSPVGIWISLAATSVGRGWDAVGHRAGTYRNTIEFRWLGRRN